MSDCLLGGFKPQLVGTQFLLFASTGRIRTPGESVIIQTLKPASEPDKGACSASFEGVLTGFFLAPRYLREASRKPRSNMSMSFPVSGD